MSIVFRCQLVLMILGAYAYGDHVRDPQAFVLRCRKILSDSHGALVLAEPRIPFEDRTVSLASGCGYVFSRRYTP